MARTLPRLSPAHSTDPNALDVSTINHLEHPIERSTDDARAANEAQLIEERKVNPLWMISAALAVLFAFGALLLVA